MRQDLSRIVVAAIVVLLAVPGFAAAQTLTAVISPSGAAPAFVRVDGSLRTATGDPRTGTVVLVVSLYAGQQDASALWSEEQTVALDNTGHYTVLAGASRADGMPAELFNANSAQWVGVAVRGEPELLRVGLVSVPYALKSREADTLAGKTATEFVLAENLATSVKAALKAGTITSVDFGAGTNGVIAGDTEITGRLTVSGTGVHTFGPGGTGATDLLLKLNGSSAAGRGPIVGFYNNGSDIAFMGRHAAIFGGESTSDALTAYGNSADGFEFMAVHPSGGIHFFSGGYTEKMTLASNGQLSVSGPISASGNLTTTGLFSATGSGLYNIGAGGVGATDLLLKLNGSSAAGRGPIIGFYTNGSDIAFMGRKAAIFGGTSTSDALTAYGGSADGFEFMAVHASGSVKFFSGGYSERMRIDPSGNVGIGTTSPSTKLHVVGDVTVTGNIGAKYQDVAEWVETVAPLEAGTVVIVDPLASDHVMPSARAYDTRVAGAVSRQPGLVLGEPGDTKSLIAQSGRVRIKVDATYGAIKPGDLLVTSPTAGHAMLSKPMKIGGQFLHRPGTLVGKALESLSAGKGEILVLLTLQ